jgi:uncharacterized phage-associated protein
MESLKTVASYVFRRYQQEHGEKIDEMKLHKLLYFAQREALVQTGEPLFEGTFYGWRYGPVIKDLREEYKNETFLPEVPREVSEKLAPVMDKIFEEYAPKDSWSLSRLTHGEISWKVSRKGIAPSESGDVAMKLEDIRRDADKIRARRDALSKYTNL